MTKSQTMNLERAGGVSVHDASPSKPTGLVFPEEDSDSAAESTPVTPLGSGAVPDVSRLYISDLPLSPILPLNSVTGQNMEAIEDEQTVNTALISLLAFITIHNHS